VLHAPDSAVGGGGRSRGPGRELLGDGADVRPFSRASKMGAMGCGGAKRGDLCAVEERGDVNVAVTLEAIEQMGGASGTGGLLCGMAWAGGSCRGV
jgi:hypothetical protein